MFPFVQRPAGLQRHHFGLLKSGQPGRSRRSGDYSLNDSPDFYRFLLRGRLQGLYLAAGARHDPLGDDEDIRPLHTLELPSQRGGDEKSDRQDDQPKIQADAHHGHGEADIFVQRVA